VVTNKQLVAFTDSESLVLSDVVTSLGHKLVRNELLSNVSCLTCARALARIYGTFGKLVAKSNNGISFPSAKRLSSNSPTGTSPLAKRTRPAGNFNRTPTRRALFHDDPRSSAEKENDNPLAGLKALADKMESAMNLPEEDSRDTIMKVRNEAHICFQMFLKPKLTIPSFSKHCKDPCNSTGVSLNSDFLQIR